MAALADQAAALGDTDGAGPLVANTPLSASSVGWAPDSRMIGGQSSSFGAVGPHQSQASTAGPVVDTTKSFSVAAWAKLTDSTADRIVAAQVGSTRARFALYFSATSGKWQFKLWDVDGARRRERRSTAPPRRLAGGPMWPECMTRPRNQSASMSTEFARRQQPTTVPGTPRGGSTSVGPWFRDRFGRDSVVRSPRCRCLTGCWSITTSLGSHVHARHAQRPCHADGWADHRYCAGVDRHRDGL